MPTESARVAIYARVSTKDQSCEMQLRDLRTYCGARAYQQVTEYVDTGHSGAKDSRPELNRMMDDVRKRKIDAVIVWRFDRFPESHRFQIPQGSHWNDVRATATNVGAALQRAMREIEKANPDSLYGVFGDAQWSNKERLSDALLKDLIEHFSKLPLGKSNVTSDLLGDAYEHTLCRTRYQPA